MTRTSLRLELFTACVFLIGCRNDGEKQQTQVQYPQPEEFTADHWDVETLKAQLLEFSQVPLPVGQPIIEQYLALMQEGDGACPGDPYELTPDLTNGCLANTGYFYHGIAECFSTEDFDFVLENLSAETIQTPDMSGWEVLNSHFLVGDFEILRPEGVPFSAGGWVLNGLFQEDSKAFLFGGITGSWKDPAGLTQWHQQGISSLFFYQLEPMSSSEEELVLTLNGVLGVQGHYVRFDEFKVFEGCAVGFQGVLEIRDFNGRWHRLVGVDECGCAQHTYLDEVSQEEICLDWSGALSHYHNYLEAL
ncbi:MAG: hypothetical protein CMK59_05795 [Proteobacteria bacterium]|nr:hypothetical protein [Pseudomonadota bacterium]